MSERELQVVAAATSERELQVVAATASARELQVAAADGMRWQRAGGSCGRAACRRQLI